METSKCWFIEDEQGNVNGFESHDRVSAEEVKEFLWSQWGMKVKVYKTTRYDLYMSGVDVY